MGAQGLNADERSGLGPNGKVSFTVEAAAEQLDRSGHSWSAGLGQPAIVSYAFRESAPAQMPEGVSGFQQVAGLQIRAIELAFAAWSDVANIQFVHRGDGDAGVSATYTNTATILVSDYTHGPDDVAAFTYYPGSLSASSSDGDIWISMEGYESDGDNAAPLPQTYGALTLVHEIGHALGLDHPSDYDAETSNNITYITNASYYEDSLQYSVMSYFDASDTGGSSGLFTDYPTAPQIDDIAAAQRLYGANYSTRTGDDVYGFNSNLAGDGGERPWYSISGPNNSIIAAIWDGGGNDTVDFSLYSQPQLIDLRGGSFSNVGGGVGNVAIAAGADIENALGGYGDDTLIGNGLDNRLSGGGADDLITATAGHDLLDGGDGADAVLLSGFAHDYHLSLSAGAGALSGGPENAADTLASIEDLRFQDGELTFDSASTAARVVRLYDSFLGRAPDAAGFESYLRFVAAGHTFQEMADNAAASPEFKNATAKLTDPEYVTYVYEHSLHREPDSQGLQTYVQDLQNGVFTRTSLIVQAAESSEHVALTAPVVAAGLWTPNETVEALELLYDASVQRQPDLSGIAGYSAEILQGQTFKAIANQMASSAEFQAAHAQQTNAQFIESLYQAEVGRASDPNGLAAYEDQLAHGVSRGDVLYETAFSQEHQSRVLAFDDPLLGT